MLYFEFENVLKAYNLKASTRGKRYCTSHLLSRINSKEEDLLFNWHDDVKSVDKDVIKLNLMIMEPT